MAALNDQESGLASRSRILAVDDEPHILKLLELTLSFENFEVVTAQSGPEAIALASGHPPDLILLDVMMPGMDGFQVAMALKSEPRTREVPILFLTARGREVDRQRGQAVGAAEYITKPFRPSRLVALIRELLKARNPMDRRPEAGPWE